MQYCAALHVLYALSDADHMPLATPQENTENWPWEIVVLCGWLILLRVLVYVALRFKTAAPSAQQH